MPMRNTLCIRALAAKSVGIQNEVAFWLFCDAMEDYEEIYQFLIFHGRSC